MMKSDDKVGGWVKKGQNHDDVILECPLSKKKVTLKVVSIYKPCVVLVGIH